MSPEQQQTIEIARRWLNECLIFDTETTGIKSGAEIVEITVIDERGNAMLNTLVQPAGKIPIGATKIHGIDHRQVAGSPIWPDVYASLCGLIDNQLLIAYNLDFDMRMVHQSSKQYNVTSDTKVRGGCAMKLFAQFNGEWDNYHGNWSWYKLSDAARLCGVKTGSAHRALADCLMTLGIIKFIAGQEIT